ncbi:MULTISPECIES: DUF1471 domain-containing protein [Dickeya]|uniref:DUF1471 domain-containing protein n=1 Tax=Dickeya fangzhongdai TaxID=1778540 RepID=A0A2K8QSK9_9GAMM|nr:MULTISPECIES: DUF1471 domain-containing protein [Dickeya]ATZ95740.1 DUF1471 domain-containing protein [Dickeya fangzhongdai]AYH49396.1 multiple stress resistance protein BhsA [Dickeya fangzhongdai]QOH49185.1 DUF1471 domain-containing protein [Dickeya fangzhongdai]QOH53488.1 DUF1471 domain-containing protein [Dickeya fangzhongdai]UGA50330.1 DUF1471 domain-containing protein [Dickeya fangzhongdai]
MKSIKTVVAAAALATLSFGSMAATEVQSVQSRDLGTVSATARTLDDLQAQLSAKADAAGAKSFRIITATGDEQLRGVAELYN